MVELSFGDTINLSNSFNIHSTLPSLTLLNENVYIAWTEGPLNDGEVYYRRSTDGGTSFGETVNLSNDTGDSVRPELRVSAPNLFIVWQNQAVKGDDIFFKRRVLMVELVLVIQLISVTIKEIPWNLNLVSLTRQTYS